MTNENTWKKILEVADALNAAGLDLVSYGSDRVSFTMKSKVRKTYMGTYLNQFTVDDKVRLWKDEWAQEYPQVTVEAVYRHNGTAEDVSVSVSFCGFHTSITPFPDRWKYAKTDASYVAAVREGSPYFYLDDESPLSVATSGQGERVAKLRNTAGKKAITNAVAKAVAMCEAFEPADHSGYGKDPGKYHADTSAEFNEWTEYERKTRGTRLIQSDSRREKKATEEG